jgi:MoxR-like ATPase
MNRKANLLILLGYNGTGKTSFLRKLTGKAERSLIITPDYSEWNEVKEISVKEIAKFKGKARIIYRKNILQELINRYNKGLLILDDYRGFGITSNSHEAEILRTLVIRRRQKMIDIAISGHGFTEIVPRFLFTFASHLALFKTIDNIDRIKGYVQNFDFLVKKQEEINRKSNPNELKEFMTYHEIIKL